MTWRRLLRAGSPTASAAGISLIELILAVFLLGTATVTILGAFATLIKTSDFTRKAGDVSATVGAVAEAVTDNGRNPYVTCNPTYNPKQGVTLPTKVDAEITAVSSWNGTGFVTTCDAATEAWRLQQIDIVVHVQTANGVVDRAISVVKRG